MGVPEEILEINERLEPHKEKDTFLPFEKLRDLFDEYHVLVGAGLYPLSGKEGHIPPAASGTAEASGLPGS